MIAVRNLTIAYRTPEGAEVEAVRAVSFALGAGETLGIIGESGCGKSTLSRALLGHLRPGSFARQGAVLLDGESLLDAPPERLRRLRGGVVALVPQQPLSALTPHIRVGAQVAEVVRAHRPLDRGAAQAAVLAQFARTRLPDPPLIAQRFPHEISGGQRQRVAIAAALAGAPRCLVLDEPTTALDKATEADVLALVAELRAQTGAALVYVSHDLRVIREMCQRVLVMRQGRIVEDGPVAEVFRQPRTAYACALLDAIPDLARLARPHRTDARAAGARPAAYRAAPLLQIDDLGFRYPVGRSLTGARRRGPPVLSAVSLAVGRGESFGIVGESGSGKSTLAAIVAGLLDGATGAMHFDGTVLSGRARRRPTELRRRIQLVFQDPLSALNPAHTVETIVTRPMRMFFGRAAADARREAARLLGTLDLDPELLSRRPAELSGGQQQRVALARAFAAEPDLVICDEVTSALDVTVQAHLVGLLKRLREERATSFLFISHDLGFIADVADATLVLEGGRIRAAGATAEVLGQPSDAYTRALVAAYRGRAASNPELAEA